MKLWNLIIILCKINLWSEEIRNKKGLIENINIYNKWK